ncbi:transmembrane-type terpene cyclase, partial [Nostoc sp.]|uniref:transmembrane-type terpene cyclase n=1 Tax=Nostoc sp. TaxID=1180 RepID=UPI003027A084
NWKMCLECYNFDLPISMVSLLPDIFVKVRCSLPLVALCANISWEFIFSFLHPHQPPQLQVNIVWFFLDVIILFEFLKFGQSELRYLPKKLFFPIFLLTLVVSFFLYFLSPMSFMIGVVHIQLLDKIL